MLDVSFVLNASNMK